MRITVKVNAPAGKKPATIVRDRLKNSRAKATVEEVFPGETAGRRAGLVLVSLPDHVSDEDFDEVLEQLRDDEHIEYAERSSTRTPKS